MSRTIWLVVEGRTDGEIVRAILKRKYPQISVRVLKPTGNQPSLSRLARQIDNLIRAAVANRQEGDCIAVLHDADLQTRPHLSDRMDYKRISDACLTHKREVKHVIAFDEIESWLLADSGLCSWLQIRPQIWDEKPKPSVELANRLDEIHHLKYREDNLRKILEKLDGNNLSPSLKKAFKHLEDAPCTR